MGRKILAIGDFHGDSKLSERMAQKADEEGIEAIIITGDLNHFDNPMPGILSPLTRNYRKVFLIPGNHDSNTTLNLIAEMYPGVENIHGHGRSLGETGIFGSGYADLGPFWISEEEILQNLEKGHEKIKDLKNKIMVTHIHPEGSHSEFSGAEGSQATRYAIEKLRPKILLHGHIHEGGGIEEKIGDTKVINVARKYKIFEA